MGKGNILGMLFAFSFHLNAANIIDVYGIEPLQAELLIKNYGASIGDIESQFLKEIMKISNGGKEQHLEEVILPKKKQLISKIKKRYDLAYVEFETVFYPGNKDLYTTVEVVHRNEPDRLRLIPQKRKTKPSAVETKHDLVSKMVEFKNTAMEMLFNNQVDQKAECPVYHCLPGFNHPALRNTSQLFTQRADKEKKLLISTIGNDPVSDRRVAAIFLTGYLSDPHQIIALLNNYIMDADSAVRNSAMRVIAETMNKSKIYAIDVLPLLKLLDSPVETDRNKALFVLLYAANEPSARQVIIQQGHKSLIALLRLKQLNNRDIAYALLKKISNEDFGRNVAAWVSWLNKMNKSTA